MSKDWFASFGSYSERFDVFVGSGWLVHDEPNFSLLVRGFLGLDIRNLSNGDGNPGVPKRELDLNSHLSVSPAANSSVCSFVVLLVLSIHFSCTLGLLTLCQGGKYGVS